MGKNRGIESIFNSDVLQDPFQYIKQIERKTDLLFKEKFNGPLLDDKFSTATRGPANLKKREFQWDYLGKRKVVVRMPEEAYLRWSEKNGGNRNVTALGNSDNETVRELAQDLYTKAKINNFDRRDTSHFILSFVQYIPYSKAGKHPKHPIETLWENEGTCIDFSILSAAIFSNLDYEVAVILLPDENHAMLGISGNYRGKYVVHGGTQYYLAETTKTGKEIGESSYNTDRAQVKTLGRRTNPNRNLGFHFK